MTSPPMKPGPMRKTVGDILDGCYVEELAAIDVVFMYLSFYGHLLSNNSYW